MSFDVDRERLNRYLARIRENIWDLEEILSSSDADILSSTRDMKALKYCLIEVAEAMANTLQHLLARRWGKVVDSYLGLIDEAMKREVMDKDLLSRLKFFFRFRNFLVHRYWEIEDQTLLQNTRKGLQDFLAFIREAEAWIEEQR